MSQIQAQSCFKDTEQWALDSEISPSLPLWCQRNKRRHIPYASVHYCYHLSISSSPVVARQNYVRRATLLS